MPPAPAAPLPPLHLRDGLAVAAAALLAYVLLLQDVFVNEDAYVFLATLGQGIDASRLHPLYGRVAAAFADLLTPLGIQLFRALELVSAAGVAAAVVLFHASTRVLGRTRATRALAAGLLAAMPGVVFFATVIEIPGLFLAFAALAWWLASGCAHRPSWGRAALVGAATALATMVHATGHLLAGLTVAFVWARPWRRSHVWAAAAIAAAHVGAFVTLDALLFGETAQMGKGADWFAAYLSGRSNLRPLPRVAWREYVVPFFPLSLLAPALLFVRGARLPSALYHVCVGVYVFVSFVMIPGLDERGTYALPLALFGVALLAAHLPRAALAAALVLAAAAALWLVRAHDVPPPDPVAAEDVLALAPGGHALLVLEGPAECDPVVRHAPHVPVTRAFQLAALPGSGAELGAVLDASFARFLADGRRIVISQRALDFLAAHRPDLHAHLLAHYHLERVRSGRFVAWVVGT